MKILELNNKPIAEFRYLNAGRKANAFTVDRLPVFHGTVDDLPASLDAIMVTADLQGLETPQTSLGQPPRLMGQILPTQMTPVFAELGIDDSNRIGAILAGDFFTYQDLHGRGGTGDVSKVWKAFSREFKWVVGVAGNHDTFGKNKSTPPRSTMSHVHFLDGERLNIDGIQIAGISGVIGNPAKNFRRTDEDILETVELLTSTTTDIALMHEGPDGNRSGYRGIEEVRKIVEKTRPSLVIRGHKHWPEPLVELSSGVQILNVEATVVVLTRTSDK
ncbi:MAG: metallophosphoesterase [Mariniblastus sp.]